eukprot:904379-Prymnesium_polylepis.1
MVDSAAYVAMIIARPSFMPRFWQKMPDEEQTTCRREIRRPAGRLTASGGQDTQHDGDAAWRRTLSPMPSTPSGGIDSSCESNMPVRAQPADSPYRTPACDAAARASQSPAHPPRQTTSQARRPPLAGACPAEAKTSARPLASASSSKRGVDKADERPADVTEPRESCCSAPSSEAKSAAMITSSTSPVLATGIASSLAVA